MEVSAAPLTLIIIGMNSVVWAFVLVVVLRLPATGLIWMMGSLLCTMAALTEPTRARRAVSKVWNFLTFGALQFFYAVLEPGPLVLTLAVPLMVLLVSIGRDSNNAGAILTASLMGYNRGRFESALDIFCLVVTLAAIVAPTGLLLEKLLFGKAEWRGLPPAPVLGGGALLRRMGTYCTVFALYGALPFDFAYWIPLTAGFAYSNGGTGWVSKRFAARRALGTLLGYPLAAIWMSATSYLDVRLNYLAVFWGIAAYYYRYRTGDVIGYSALFILMICCVDNMLGSSVSPYGNGWNMVVQSCFFSLTGAAILQFFEWGQDGD